MPTLIATSAACWLCALFALPRRPLPGTEAAELVYARLLGRQQRLVLLASVLTLATLLIGILALPSRIGASTPPPERVCTAVQTCFVSRPDGRWEREERAADGRWVSRGVEDLPAVADPARGYG